MRERSLRFAVAGESDSPTDPLSLGGRPRLVRIGKTDSL